MFVAVRLRGLPWSATKEDIKNFFSVLRLSSRLTERNITFITQGHSRPSGEAYVVFDCEEDAREALTLDKKKMGSRWIDVFLTTKSEAQATEATISAIPDGNYAGLVRLR